jgi:hypothetical protein
MLETHTPERDILCWDVDRDCSGCYGMVAHLNEQELDRRDERSANLQGGHIHETRGTELYFTTWVSLLMLFWLALVQREL